MGVILQNSLSAFAPLHFHTHLEVPLFLMICSASRLQGDGTSDDFHLDIFEVLWTISLSLVVQF